MKQTTFLYAIELVLIASIIFTSCNEESPRNENPIIPNYKVISHNSIQPLTYSTEDITSESGLYQSINDSTFVETTNQNVVGSKYIHNRINMALANKSLSNTGLTMLKLYKFDSLGTEINWQLDNVNSSYYAQFSLTEDAKTDLENLLTVELKGPGKPKTECCQMIWYGYDQPDYTKDLFVFGTGRGLQNVYGIGNTFKLSVYDGCNYDRFRQGYGVVPNQETSPCIGIDTWYIALNLKSSVWLNSGSCSRFRIVRTHGYASAPNVYVPVCSGEIKLKWGTDAAQ